MTWIGGRLLKWRFGDTNTERASEDASDAGGPRLIILAADASGLASFHLHTFTDAETAVHFIQRSFGDRSDTGLIAFWAFTQKPAVTSEPGGDTDVEAIVMVRDDLRPEVVYPFSFVDISSAQQFVRYELKRAVNPNHVLLYWAVPVQLVITADGESRLFPETAPDVTGDQAHDTVAATPATVAEAPSMVPPKGAAINFDELFTSAADDPIETLFKNADAPVAEKRLSDSPAKRRVSEAPAGHRASSTRWVYIDHRDAEDNAGGGDETQEDVREDFVAEEIDEQFSEGAEKMVHEDEEAAVTNSNNGTAARPSAPVIFQPEPTAQPIGLEFPAGKASTGREASQTTTSEELQKVLSVRRWEAQTEPFTGFRSPPGRF